MAECVLAFPPDAPHPLALDRTQWMLGGTPISFLVPSVVHDGIAFALFWKVPIRKIRARLKNPTYAAAEYLAILTQQGLVATAAELEIFAEVI